VIFTRGIAANRYMSGSALAELKKSRCCGLDSHNDRLKWIGCWVAFHAYPATDEDRSPMLRVSFMQRTHVTETNDESAIQRVGQRRQVQWLRPSNKNPGSDIIRAIIEI
jgi:hypothetical protein